MRLHEDLIKQGILHPEQDVRDEAVLYFSRSSTSDESVLPLAIQAIEQYGWDNAFSAASCIRGLPLNETTLPWVLTQLQHPDAKKPDSYGWDARWRTLNSLLSDSNAELLARCKRAILDVQCLEEEVMDIIGERIDLLTTGGDFCWEELEKFCVESKDINDIGQVDLDHAYALCEAIGRERDKYAEKVLSILSERIENFESNPKVWMETFAIRMAGEMRLEAAAPLIITKLKEGYEDDDWLTEECDTALVKIGGDAVIAAVADLFRQGEWHLRMAACNVLQHIHRDLSVATALEFLPIEKDGTLRAFLADGLLAHFAFEAIEPVRQIVLDGNYDETYADLKRGVVVAATLMGVEFPEREPWKADVERKRLERERRRAQERLEDERHAQEMERRRLEEENRRLDEEAGSARRRVGRNDPCPCGSGKKFKKCCLNKYRSDDLLV